MPPYETMHIENLIWVFGAGALFTLAIVLARTSRYFTWTFKRRSEEELEEETHEFGGGVREQNRPMPLFIWLMVVGYFIWATSYVVFSGAFGL